jgi:hypothetical protein
MMEKVCEDAARDAEVWMLQAMDIHHRPGILVPTIDSSLPQSVVDIAHSYVVG